MARPLKLSLLLGADYDRTRALCNGTVKAEGIDHNWSNLGHHECFARFTANREFDVSELSFAKFCAQVTRKDSDLIGLPVVCSRLFRFSSFYVNKKSKIKSAKDLKGKKVAHTAPSSNSGHMAPLALFPSQGLTPDKDYKILFSGKHDSSVMGVNSGDYDGAAVASDVYHRMGTRGQINEDNFRIIYRSQKFPTSSFSYAHDLEPKFRDQMLKCFYDYRFTPEMQKTFDGADRFVPVTYLKDWEVVRKVAEGSGEAFNRAAYEKESAREEAARKKAAEDKAKK